ncbi:MAG: metallophosphoesterase [Clostridiales bacterium]|nr:metallophosphoesterase [Clostridiales bacterium]
MKFVIATDIHYISRELIKNKNLFLDILKKSDGKVINYISYIFDAFIEEVIAIHPDGVILSGDLSYNGEKISHEELKAKLNILKNNNIDVFIIPGNHDINNFLAKEINDKMLRVSTVTPAEFLTIYKYFGYNNSFKKDPTSLSYIIKATENHWLFFLDSCLYNENTETKTISNGNIKDSTYNWLEINLRYAKKNKIFPIIVCHHNLLIHNSVFYKSFTLDNNTKILKLLEKYNVKIFISGHTHLQSIVSYNNEVYDISTNALGLYPNQYGILEINNNEIKYNSAKVNVTTWARNNNLTSPDLMNFETYSYNFFKSISYNKKLNEIASLELPAEIASEMAKGFSLLNINYFSGRIHEYKETFISSKYYKLWMQYGNDFNKKYINSILNTENIDSNSFTLKL